MVTAGQGIGFAIPINTVRSVEQDLVAHRTVRRGGSAWDPGPPSGSGRRVRSEGRKGILVNRVVLGSPAERGRADGGHPGRLRKGPRTRGQGVPEAGRRDCAWFPGDARGSSARGNGWRRR